MKLKCLKLKDGLIFKTKGLTIGKIYYGSPVTLSIGNWDTGGNIKFVIFNDDKEWKTYDKELFEPAGE